MLFTASNPPIDLRQVAAEFVVVIDELRVGGDGDTLGKGLGHVQLKLPRCVADLPGPPRRNRANPTAPCRSPGSAGREYPKDRRSGCSTHHRRRRTQCRKSPNQRARPTPAPKVRAIVCEPLWHAPPTFCPSTRFIRRKCRTSSNRRDAERDLPARFRARRSNADKRVCLGYRLHGPPAHISRTYPLT